VGDEPGGVRDVLVVVEVAVEEGGVVSGGVGEHGRADHVADGIDTGACGGVLVVDSDESLAVGFDPGDVEVEAVGVGGAARGDHQLCPGDFPAVQVDGDAAGTVRGHPLRLDPEMHVDSFIGERLVYDLGDFGVFAGEEPVGSLDDADFGSEPSVHLGVFAADVAAADDDEMVGEVGEVEGGGGIEPWDGVEAGDGWDVGSGPGVDDDPLCPIAGAVGFKGVRVDESGWRFDQGEIVGAGYGPVGTVSDLGNHMIFTGDHSGQVNSDGADFDSELACPAG